MPIETRMSAAEAGKHITGLARFMAPLADPAAMTKPLQDWGEYMLVRTDVLFATGSRDGVRWARLADSTKAGRKARGIGHARPLDATGDLRRSIRTATVSSFDGLTQRVYTQHARAKIHHRGATIPAHRVEARGKALRFVVGGQVVYAKHADIPEFKIPSRTIIFISDRDHATSIRYVREYRLKLMRQAVKNAKAGSGGAVGISVGQVLA